MIILLLCLTLLRPITDSETEYFMVRRCYMCPPERNVIDVVKTDHKPRFAYSNGLCDKHFAEAQQKSNPGIIKQYEEWASNPQFPYRYKEGDKFTYAHRTSSDVTVFYYVRWKDKPFFYILLNPSVEKLLKEIIQTKGDDGELFGIAIVYKESGDDLVEELLSHPYIRRNTICASCYDAERIYFMANQNCILVSPTLDLTKDGMSIAKWREQESRL